jgi:hypothetical protein
MTIGNNLRPEAGRGLKNYVPKFAVSKMATRKEDDRNKTRNDGANSLV